MKPDLAAAIHLLHRAPFGVLATHAVRMPGYPFSTALPFVVDEAHCPVFLLSGLAEHTKNLLASPQASLLVIDAGQANVLESPRMTLVGDVHRIDAAPALRERYVRYLPDAEQYLALGDFAFFRLVPQRVRYIGGFAQMGWLEQDAWQAAQVLGLDEEADLLRGFGAHVLGVDCYGIDLVRDGHRERAAFDDVLSPAHILDEAKRVLAEESRE